MRWPLIAAGAVAAAGLVAVGRAAAAWGRPAHQPIAFNHRVHLEGAGLACVDCHLHAVDGVRATIPNIDVCAPCHTDPQGKTAAEADVVAHVRAGTRIPWAQVHSVPDHVYFSHRRHTAQGELACEVCHGNVRERVKPFTRPAVSVRMSWCTDCHATKEARNDCVGCHR